MEFKGQGRGRTRRVDALWRQRPPGVRRNMVGLGVLGVLAALLAQTLAVGGPAAASSSNVDPNGVLKYGFDLNNEFRQRLRAGDRGERLLLHGHRRTSTSR